MPAEEPAEEVPEQILSESEQQLMQHVLEHLTEAPAEEPRPEPVPETAVQPEMPEAPAEQAPQRRRAPAPEASEAPRRRRPAPEAGRPGNRGQRPAHPGQKNRPPEENPGDTVFKMENAPRRNAAAPERTRKRKPAAPRRMPENIPSRRGDALPSIKNAPQGTSYKRHSARVRTSLFDKIFKSKVGKDPELMADEARMKLMQRDEVEEKRKKHALRFDTPAIVYTDPKPFNRNRLLIQLVTVLSVASAFVLALSIFFKVKVITVSGADTYSAWSVREASGIMEGDNLLTFGRARASGQITANLPYVESVRIGIKLPDTVNIEIQELDVAYSIKSGDGDWWLMTSSGKVVDQINEGTAKNYTQVLGVAIDNPVPGEQAYAVEVIPEGTTAEGETMPVIVSGAARLNAAMQILSALEDNDIVGDAASVNVENLEKIELWYGQRYQVNLGDTSGLDEKVACMYDVILQLSDYQTGMLDISYTKKKDQVIYTPFA